MMRLCGRCGRCWRHLPNKVLPTRVPAGGDDMSFYFQTPDETSRGYRHSSRKRVTTAIYKIPDIPPQQMYQIPWSKCPHAADISNITIKMSPLAGTSVGSVGSVGRTRKVRFYAPRLAGSSVGKSTLQNPHTPFQTTFPRPHIHMPGCGDQRLIHGGIGRTLRRRGIL